MKKLVLGVMAHVDAGKTTLSESILYLSGSIRKMGRVDNGDAFLDNFELEKARGITIFSKQAEFQLKDNQYTLMDTPGHVDFSAEMERTLQILDYAVLVISGADGVQGHTLTLWNLLKRYQIPVILFVNKMDQPGTDREKLLIELKEKLDDGCLDFGISDTEEDEKQALFLENIAMNDETILEYFLEHGSVEKQDIIEAVAARKIFPCYFGSALKLNGVQEFLQGIDEYTKSIEYPSEFGAKVFKITRDEQGNRLTHLKVTGGSLKPRTTITDTASGEEEKINQLRIYSGARYETVNEALPGTVCAVTGLFKTYPGEGLGIEKESEMPVLEPVLTYRIILPSDCEANSMLPKLRQLEEEEPQLHLAWNEELKEIQAQLMGEVQIEILKSMIKERFGIEVEFGTGNIVYKETIAAPAEGVGHFEPLRHYAEVHLLLEPGEPGSGLQFASHCSEDILDRNWQRLILTHLEEKEHRGILTGSVITDMKITLIAGRAHQKHTEGGDFRQATYRAVRQGLMQTESVLLEPFYEFRLEVPPENLGRALNDLTQMFAVFQTPELERGLSVVKGSGPVSMMRDYQREVISYSRGRGHLSCTLKGYFPCHNAEEVIAKTQYDPELDLNNPTGSVFCSHGAGYVVSWDMVPEYMHVDSGRGFYKDAECEEDDKVIIPQYQDSDSKFYVDDEELKEILSRTYGANTSKKKQNASGKAGWKGIARGTGINQGARTVGGSMTDTGTGRGRTSSAHLEEYLLVDGYNVIFSWDNLNELAKMNMDSARAQLMDILCNYQGYRNYHIILVFDAYKVEGHLCEIIKYHNIHVVYTKEAETADQYIEKTAHEIGRKYRVTVATSDGLEQVIIRGQGCLLMSSKELKEDVERVKNEIQSEHLEKQDSGKNYLFHHLPENLAGELEEMRLGKKKWEEIQTDK